MKQEKLKEITQLFLEFHPIHQKKVASIFSKNTSDPYHCTANQVKAIMIIGGNKSIIPTVLGKGLGLQKGSLTTLLDSLEKLDLIKRNAYPDDRRKTLISLTSKGDEYRDLRMTQFECELSEMFNEFPEVKLDEFIPCFTRVIEMMKKL